MFLELFIFCFLLGNLAIYFFAKDARLKRMFTYSLVIIFVYFFQYFMKP